MRQLVSLGLVEESAADVFLVPQPLRGVVAKGLMTALAAMSAMDDLDVEDGE